MKKLKSFLNVLLCVTIVSLFTNCTSEEIQTDYSNQKSIELKSKVNDSIFNKVNSNLNAYLEGGTRSADYSEAEVKEILSPLVPSGASMRNELVNMALEKQLDIPSTDMEMLQKMSDPELAEFAYVMHEMQDVLDDPINNPQGLQITVQNVFDCLSFAIGYKAVTGAWGYYNGTASVISARTAWNIARGMISRTIGWIGVAWALYDFGKCLSRK